MSADYSASCVLNYHHALTEIHIYMDFIAF